MKRLTRITAGFLLGVAIVAGLVSPAAASPRLVLFEYFSNTA